MAIYPLRNWAVVSNTNDGYLAPECRTKSLQGLCEARNEVIRTSAICDFDPTTGVVKTCSGSEYMLLGRPYPEFAEYVMGLVAKGHLNRADPLAMFTLDRIQLN